jgi:hypothetical protein
VRDEAATDSFDWSHVPGGGASWRDYQAGRKGRILVDHGVRAIRRHIVGLPDRQ